MTSVVLEEKKDLANSMVILYIKLKMVSIKHIVDIRRKICTCRTCILRGIPCQHVVLAYQHRGIETKHEVLHWYKKKTF